MNSCEPKKVSALTSRGGGVEVISDIMKYVHKCNYDLWHDENGRRLDLNKGELLCLIHSEISEAVEGERHDSMDGKLACYPQAAVELADAVIRIFDYCEGFGYDLAGAIRDKIEYNKAREDHRIEIINNRKKKNKIFWEVESYRGRGNLKVYETEYEYKKKDVFYKPRIYEYYGKDIEGLKEISMQVIPDMRMKDEDRPYRNQERVYYVIGAVAHKITENEKHNLYYGVFEKLEDAKNHIEDFFVKRIWVEENEKK